MLDIRRIASLWGIVLCLLGIGVGSASASVPPPSTPQFSFTYSNWSPAEQAILENDLKANGPVIKTVTEVDGSLAESVTLEITKATGNPGDYESGCNCINLEHPSLSVLVHELGHATRGSRDLAESVWEEGLARAAEKEVMYRLSLQGITEPGYDINHEYGYDEYYENDNVFTVGVPYGNIFIETALTLLRYEQAGYALGKVEIENPGFIAGLDAKILAHAPGVIGQEELVKMAAEVQPTVEGLPFASWEKQQFIFNTEQHQGCYLFVRSNQFTVDDFCIGQYGEVTSQENVAITLSILSATHEVLFERTLKTSDYGWVGFEPPPNVYVGRIKIVATAESPEGPVETTVYRQSGSAEGVFGVVTNADTGTVSFRSLSGQFEPLSIPVISGAFVAPSLGTIRGQLVAEFNGEGQTVTRTFTKDAAPFSLVLTAKPTPPQEEEKETPKEEPKEGEEKTVTETPGGKETSTTGSTTPTTIPTTPVVSSPGTVAVPGTGAIGTTSKSTKRKPACRLIHVKVKHSKKTKTKRVCGKHHHKKHKVKKKH